MQPVAISYFNQSLNVILQNVPDVLILQGYGTGNIAVDARSIQLLQDIQQKGCNIILDTQVTFGGLDQRYAVSQWVKQSQLLVNDAHSHSDLYAKILKMYLQYPSSDQWHDHWYDHSN
jgi:L-asparaginase